jgi:RNA polymerase sigma-70 factor (ECF subfamily)
MVAVEFDDSSSHAPEPRCATVPERKSAFERGQHDWPGLSVTFSQFTHHLDGIGYRAGLPRHLGAVFLCVGCTVGLADACSALDRSYLSALRPTVRRLVRNNDAAEDVLQEVRNRLLVGPSPKIATYRGEGSLASWLRIIALNVARDYKRSCVSETRRFSRLKDLCHPKARTIHPDDAYFLKECSRVCEMSLLSAVASLAEDERILLRNHFVLGVGIDELGRLYSVDRSTAARRILRSVQAVRCHLEDKLSNHFGGLNAHELSELLRQLYGYVDIDGLTLLSASTPPSMSTSASAAPEE